LLSSGSKYTSKFYGRSTFVLPTINIEHVVTSPTAEAEKRRLDRHKRNGTAAALLAQNLQVLNRK